MHRISVAARFTALAATVASIAAGAHAQCLHWGTEFGRTSGLDRSVDALGTFDLGQGPRLYVGGLFTTAGGIAASKIAAWDGTSWSALGEGVHGSVSAMAVFNDGSGPALFTSGTYSLHGSSISSHLERWNGSTWSVVDGEFDERVWALSVFDDGTGPALYAGGGFTHVGSASANGIAKWNGSSWSPLANGISGSLNGFPPQVFALATYDDGSGSALFVGGLFQRANGLQAHSIAKWNGSWSTLGNGTFAGVNGYVSCLTVGDLGSGDVLYAGGLFSTWVGGQGSQIAAWNGTAWSALGGGVGPGGVSAACIYNDGSGPGLYVAGDFITAGVVDASMIARWNGTAWSNLNVGLNYGGLALAVFDGGRGPALYVGGDFYRAGDIPSTFIGVWGSCSSGFDPFCFGDGSGAPCPCGNSGSLYGGCENSASTDGGRLYATGGTNPDTLVLHAIAEPVSAPSIFLQGDAAISATNFGDGLRCVGGRLTRLYVKTALDGTCSAPGPGDASVSARSAQLGDPIAPGATRYYQTYYRDPSLTFCPSPQGDTWNVTTGLIVPW